MTDSNDVHRLAGPAGKKDKFLGVNGARLIKQLFVEYSYVSDHDHAIYTLARHDKEVNGKLYPSLYRLYMEEGDVTEARFVEKYLYDWEQWERICKTSSLLGEVERWRKDLRAKVTGDLVDRLVQDAFDKKSRSSTSSAKYLLDNIVKGGRKQTNKGRPSNQAKTEDTDLVSDQLRQDLERVQNVRKLKSGDN